MKLFLKPITLKEDTLEEINRGNYDVNNFISKLQQNCKLSVVKEFEADEIITTFLLRRNQFCILIEGEAQLSNQGRFCFA